MDLRWKTKPLGPMLIIVTHNVSACFSPSVRGREGSSLGLHSLNRACSFETAPVCGSAKL